MAITASNRTTMKIIDVRAFYFNESLAELYRRSFLVGLEKDFIRERKPISLSLNTLFSKANYE